MLLCNNSINTQCKDKMLYGHVSFVLKYAPVLHYWLCKIQCHQLVTAGSMKA